MILWGCASSTDIPWVVVLHLYNESNTMYWKKFTFIKQVNFLWKLITVDVQIKTQPSSSLFLPWQERNIEHTLIVQNQIEDWIWKLHIRDTNPNSISNFWSKLPAITRSSVTPRHLYTIADSRSACLKASWWNVWYTSAWSHRQLGGSRNQPFFPNAIHDTIPLLFSFWVISTHFEYIQKSNWLEFCSCFQQFYKQILSALAVVIH